MSCMFTHEKSTRSSVYGSLKLGHCLLPGKCADLSAWLIEIRIRNVFLGPLGTRTVWQSLESAQEPHKLFYQQTPARHPGIGP